MHEKLLSKFEAVTLSWGKLVVITSHSFSLNKIGLDELNLAVSKYFVSQEWVFYLKAWDRCSWKSSGTPLVVLDAFSLQEWDGASSFGLPQPQWLERRDCQFRAVMAEWLKREIGNWICPEFPTPAFGVLGWGRAGAALKRLLSPAHLRHLEHNASLGCWFLGLPVTFKYDLSSFSFVDLWLNHLSAAAGL